MTDTVTTSTTTMERGLQFTGEHSALLTAAYNVSVWSDEVKLQGHPSGDFLAAIKDLGLGFDSVYVGDRGVVYADYRGPAPAPFEDVTVRVIAVYVPQVKGMCDTCDPIATPAHPAMEHYTSPATLAERDRRFLQSVPA